MIEPIYFIKAHYIDEGKTKLYSHVLYDEILALTEYHDLKNDKNYFDVTIEAKLF